MLARLLLDAERVTPTPMPHLRAWELSRPGCSGGREGPAVGEVSKGPAGNLLGGRGGGAEVDMRGELGSGGRSERDIAGDFDVDLNMGVMLARLNHFGLVDLAPHFAISDDDLGESKEAIEPEGEGVKSFSRMSPPVGLRAARVAMKRGETPSAGSLRVSASRRVRLTKGRRQCLVLACL